MKKTSFTKRIFSGFGMLLVSDLTSLILVLATINFFENIFVLFLIGILNMVILVTTMLGYAYKYGEQDKKLQKRGNPIDLNMSKKLAVIVSIPPVLLWGALIVSKLGVIWDFMPVYKLVNAYFMPFIQIFAGGLKASTFPAYGLLILFILILFIPASIYFGYDLGYKQVDLTLKIFYKKKS